MSDDAVYEVGPDWAAVEIAATDITNGTFTITSRGGKDVFLARRSAVPSPAAPGAYILSGKGSSATYLLAASDFLYARCEAGTALVGVIPA
tara:strand:+ start:4400 stop:4672 length:273 start_codon:yes stop_codon:yes gene_type:complete